MPIIHHRSIIYCIIKLQPDKSTTIWQMHLTSRQENFLSIGALVFDSVKFPIKNENFYYDKYPLCISLYILWGPSLWPLAILLLRLMGTMSLHGTGCYHSFENLQPMTGPWSLVYLMHRNLLTGSHDIYMPKHAIIYILCN